MLSVEQMAELPRVGPGHPLFPLVHSLSHLLLFFTFSFSHSLYQLSFFVHPFPFYQNSPTPFPGRMSYEATEPGFSLLFILCLICIPWLRLILEFCCIWFSLVLWCSSSLPLL